MNKAVFFDRDGVINKIGKDGTIRHIHEVVFTDGIKDVIREVREEGFLPIIITNQPEIARGTLDIANYQKVEKYIEGSLGIEATFYCPHDDKDNCRCRKPKPGMILDAAEKYWIDLNQSYMVGDRLIDLQAGRKAGCVSILFTKEDNDKHRQDCFYYINNLSELLPILRDHSIASYFADIAAIANRMWIFRDKLSEMIDILFEIRVNKGRVFFIGVGGGAGNSSHAAADFRKLTGIEAYSLFDNVSELTARTNDDGWDSTIVESLRISKLDSRDCVFVFSVGGGSMRGISTNIVNALSFAVERGTKILGVVGKELGYTNQIADVCIVIPDVRAGYITPYTESFQSVIWHFLATHPRLCKNLMTWR